SSSLTMGFGAIDVLATGSATSNPSLDVQCNKGASVSITANNGSNASGAQKRMKNGSNADTLAYSILEPTGANFSACPATIAAGTELGTGQLDVSSLWTASGGPRSVTLCGRLETPQADASPGSYTDTVVVTVTYGSRPRRAEDELPSRAGRPPDVQPGPGRLGGQRLRHLAPAPGPVGREADGVVRPDELRGQPGRDPGPAARLAPAAGPRRPRGHARLP